MVLTMKRYIPFFEKLKYKIFCDLDGVLSDFVEEFKKFGIGHPSKNDENIWEYIESEDRFWYDMKPMDDCMELWNYGIILNFIILKYYQLQQKILIVNQEKDIG